MIERDFVEINQINGFLSFLWSIDWRDPWLIGLLVFHFSIFMMAILTRNYGNFQALLFFCLLLLVYFSESINELASNNWQIFSRQQYFDSNGLFISVVFSMPILMNCILMVKMPSLRLGDVVPNFSAQTTQGPIKFYDWQGDKWVVLFSHPADFTPVCTTELGRIAVHEPHFTKRNVKLLAHSCDKLKAHVDWVNDIKSYCRDIPGEFPYPIISDEKRELAVQLDMIDQNNKDSEDHALTVRALYIIDPKHVLRLSMHYPASTGRNVDEILRVIDSLQLVDRIPQIATPANWTPGEKVMILPTVKDEEIKNLFPAGVDTVSMPSGVTYVRTTTNYKI